MMNIRGLGLCLVLCVGLVGCRGYQTTKEPFHLNPNFDWQSKVKAQANPRNLPDGVVAWGTGPVHGDTHSRADFLKEDSVYYAGKTENGAFVKTIPVAVTPELMKRGQERFNIYCAVCHNRVGTGKTPVVARGFVPPPDFADPRLLAVEDGYIFDVASNGIRNMPGYRKQINEADRWAIVAYVRAIQKARTATIQELPDSVRGKLQ
ncbi:cytochrome c [bacterium]|nr:cytochrome c [bacterium]